MFELHPQTKKLLALFEAAEYGSEFSYAEILHKTGSDVTADDRQRIYTVVRRLERDHRRTLINIRGRGYKVAAPAEFVSSMRGRAVKAKRQVSLARRTGDATPLDLLNDIDLRKHTDQMTFNAHIVSALNTQSRWNFSQDERIARIEADLRNLRGVEPVIEGVTVEEDSAA